MEDKLELLEGELRRIKENLTKKFINCQKEKEILEKSLTHINNVLKEMEDKIKNYEKEIETLQDAFELLLSDWIEDLEKQGKTRDEILAQRASFDRIMYWKKGEKFNP